MQTWTVRMRGLLLFSPGACEAVENEFLSFTFHFLPSHISVTRAVSPLSATLAEYSLCG